MNQKLLIAIVGHPSTGKDTAAYYLVKKYHWDHVSMSDLLREYISEHHLYVGEPNRDLLHRTGDMLREKHGGDYLVKLALTKVKAPAVFSGLRTIKEVQKLKKEGGTIIAVTCPIELCYARALERKGDKDHISFEKFKAQLESQAANPESTKMNVEGVLAMTDYTIENTGTIQELYAKVDEVVNKISNHFA